MASIKKNNQYTVGRSAKQAGFSRHMSYSTLKPNAVWFHVDFPLRDPEHGFGIHTMFGEIDIRAATLLRDAANRNYVGDAHQHVPYCRSPDRIGDPLGLEEFLHANL